MSVLIHLATRDGDPLARQVAERLRFEGVRFEEVSAPDQFNWLGDAAPWLRSIVPRQSRAYLDFLLRQVAHGGPGRHLFIDLQRVSLLEFSTTIFGSMGAPCGWIHRRSVDGLMVLGIPDVLLVDFPLDPKIARSELHSILIDRRSVLGPFDAFEDSLRHEAISLSVNTASDPLDRGQGVFEHLESGSDEVLPNGVVFDSAMASLCGAHLATLLGRTPLSELKELDFGTELMGFVEGFASNGDVVNRYWSVRWKEDPRLQEEFPFPNSRDNGRFVQFARHASWMQRPNRHPAVSPMNLDFAFRRASSPLRKDGFNVIGYFGARSSLGDVARAVSARLKRMGVEIAEIDFPRSSVGVEQSDGVNRELVFESNIWTTSATSLFTEFHSAPKLSSGTYNIGYLFWELEFVPPNVARSLSVLDEVWAPTEFIRSNVQSQCGEVIEYVPFPWFDPRSQDLEEVGSDFLAFANLDGSYTFGTVFDFLSGYERKNPEGAVLAFKRAFPRVEEGGPKLLLKSTNRNRRPDASSRLMALIDDRKDVIWIDGEWRESEMSRFFEKLDCYVSLHRAEGLNIPVGQALLNYTPVISTSYGGVREFGDGDFYLGVSAGRVPVIDSSGAYPGTAVWADPDLDEAASRMRQLVRGYWSIDWSEWDAFVRRYAAFCDSAWGAILTC